MKVSVLHRNDNCTNWHHVSQKKQFTQHIYMTPIQKFSDGSILTFDVGAFDEWCVYLKRPQMHRYAPTDLQYFDRFQQLGHVHGNQNIYDDFVTFYKQTSRSIDLQILNQIRQLSANYNKNSLEIEILFTIVYAGMVAEENKQFAILKKRIKRLGMHQILVEQVPPEFAATFSKGKKWRELDQICKKKGF